MLLNVSIIIVTTALVLVSLLLILLVLMQRPKQEGLGAAFGAGVTDQIWGSQTTNVLQKGTVFLGVLLFVLSLTLAMLKAADARKNTGINLKSDKPAVVEQEKPVAPSAATATSTPITIPSPGGTTSPISLTPSPAAVPAAVPSEGGEAPAKPAEPVGGTPAETPAATPPAESPAAPAESTPAPANP